MSCSKEEAIEKVSLDPEDGEATNICLDGPCSLQDLNLDTDMGSLLILSENEVETEDNSEINSGSKLQAVESGMVVFQDHRENSVSPAGDKGDLMDCLPPVSDKVEDRVQQQTDQMSQDARSHSSSKSCATQQSTAWADPEADCSRRSRLVKKLGDGKRASVAPVHRRGPKGGRACRTKKKKKITKSKKTIPEDIQDPPSDPDSSSDEYNEMQVMRVTICFKNGEQIISGNSMAPEDKIRKRNVQLRGNFHHMTGSLQMSAPKGHILGMGKLGASCSNRKASVFRGKEQSRPRYPGAVAGALRRASPKKKSAQEKKPLQDTPRVTVRRPVPVWGQRPKAAPVEVATFPPITCVPTLESSKKQPAAPLEATESTHGTSRKRVVAKNTRETQPVARGDRAPVCKDTMKNSTGMTPTSESSKVKEIAHAQLSGVGNVPGCQLGWLMSREPLECGAAHPEHIVSPEGGVSPEGLLIPPWFLPKEARSVPPHKAEQPSMCMPRAEMSSGDSNPRAPQVPANSQFVALSQGGPSSKVSAPYGDQDPPVLLPLPVGEKQHQAPGILGCQQCPLLEKEVWRLRKQLALMKALNRRFQDL
ncbi:Predicted gene 3858 [Apodemus speciosus]|uniref:Predicted gene 3858 n=1 Tax=Apodemus speciosus TaxID=105296 RepID=A0ABQ0FVA1_APOSI